MQQRLQSGRKVKELKDWGCSSQKSLKTKIKLVTSLKEVMSDVKYVYIWQQDLTGNILKENIMMKGSHISEG